MLVSAPATIFGESTTSSELITKAVPLLALFYTYMELAMFCMKSTSFLWQEGKSKLHFIFWLNLCVWLFQHDSSIAEIRKCMSYLKANKKAVRLSG